MAPEVQVGTVLMEDRPRMARFLGIESRPYAGSWSVVSTPSGSTLDRKIHAVGWNFFFLAEEVKTIFFGTVGAENIRRALKRILARMSDQDFNCLEVTGITPKRFLGVPYTKVSAHWRHIQQSYRLEDIQQRQNDQKAAAWARG